MKIFTLNVEDDDATERGGNTEYAMAYPFDKKTPKQLFRDFNRARDKMLKNETYCLGDIMRELESKGWVIVDLPRVTVSY